MTTTSVGAAPVQEAAPQHVVDQSCTTPEGAARKAVLTQRAVEEAIEALAAGQRHLLHEHDARYLMERSVPLELAIRMGIRTISQCEMQHLPEEWGLKWKSLPCLALLIPYKAATDGIPRFRLRLHETEIVRQPSPGSHHGEMVSKYPRFLATSAPVVPYIPIRRRLRQDASRPLFICEGPIKALALCAHGFLAIGLGGVEAGFHDVPDWRQGKHLALNADMAGIMWKDRRVYLVSDAGRVSNPAVARGEAKLGRVLLEAGADVRLVELSLTADGRDQGPDDLLSTQGPDEFRELVDAAVPADPVLRARNAKSGDDARALLRDLPFQAALEVGGKLVADLVAAELRKHKVSVGAVREAAKAYRMRACGKGDAEADDSSGDETLVSILRSMDLGRTVTGRVFARFGPEAMPVDTEAFRSRVSAAFHARTKGLLPKARLEDGLHVVVGEQALPTRIAPIRTAWHEGAILIDLADTEGRVIEVSADRLRAMESPIAFLRPDGTRPLPFPVFPQDVLACRATLGEWRALLDCREEVSWASALGWALAAMRPMQGPDGSLAEYPILRIKAPEGSGKTTRARNLRNAIDPREPSVVALPRDTQDLAIVSENVHVLALDNLSRISGDMSDALCRTATGDGYQTRSLYTNRDLAVFTSSKPVVVTSICDVMQSPDLLDRTLVTQVQKPERRRKKEELDAAFRALHPRLLGALCYLLRQALRERVEAPDDIRMQAAAAFAAGAEQAAGLQPDSIFAAYRAARDENREVSKSDPLVVALLSMVPVGESRSWSVPDWLDRLTDEVCDVDDRGKRIRRPPKGWPETGRALRAAMDRLRATLGELGVTIDFGGRAGHENETRWTITRDVSQTCRTLASQDSRSMTGTYVAATRATHLQADSFSGDDDDLAAPTSSFIDHGGGDRRVACVASDEYAANQGGSVRHIPATQVRHVSRDVSQDDDEEHDSVVAARMLRLVESLDDDEAAAS